MPASETQPVISVIVTVYERVEYLAQALRSAVDQTLAEPYEIVVVDDGSREPVQERFAERFPTVRWVRRENGGLCAARDAGTRAARADLLTYLDDDDVWPRDRLETQLRFLRAHPHLGVVYGDMLRFTAKGRDAEGYFRRGREQLLRAAHDRVQEKPPGYVFPRGALVPFAFDYDPLVSVTMLLRRPFLEEIGGWDTSVRGSGDCQDFFLRATWGGPVAWIDHVVLEFRRGQREHITRGLLDARRDEARTLDRTLPGYPEPLRRAARPHLVRFHARTGLSALRHRRGGLACELFGMSRRTGASLPAALAAWGQSWLARVVGRRRA